ncbi:hypothetical protein PROFUN_05807 [Planoprotostelium fungivorum]|uniref:Uncharacterized protein n=1 Tax=Planoprotostelium fungivorum TaxID=1890364 RepID=A0A2P6NPZ6_9EUKA|nr:hypothetical protein PROFUN_05807 [Planoprotostelium fungivorum]
MSTVISLERCESTKECGADADANDLERANQKITKEVASCGSRTHEPEGLAPEASILLSRGNIHQAFRRLRTSMGTLYNITAVVVKLNWHLNFLTEEEPN